MEPENIILVGARGQAKVVADIVEQGKQQRIVGLVCSNRIKDKSAFGYDIVGTVDDLPQLVVELSIVGGVVAIGDNWTRGQVVSQIVSLLPDFRFFKTLHPSAQIARDVKIGRGTVVMACASINPGTTIGEHCIVNSGACVDHDNRIESYVTIGPGATTGGDVRVGEYSAVCLGAHIINGITVGEQCVIGAGSTLVHDAPSFWTLYGAPARRRKRRKEGDPYLGRPEL